MSIIRNQISSPLGDLTYWDLRNLNKNSEIQKLPFSIRILLENIARNLDEVKFTTSHLESVLHWNPHPEIKEIPYLPARVLMQDFTGIPAIVDIVSIRSEVARKHGNPELINPQIPVDLIIDHSVQVDFFGTENSYQRNVELEYQRNHERYSLLKWAQSAFRNFNVLPPGMGICHQVNLEFLAKVVMIRDGMAFPDTLVGTDSHTPMVNGIGVLGWGVGGIEAEAAMLGQPVYFTIPEVIGLKLTGNLKEGSTATDLVLSVADILRKKGVVGKFVEVFGEGLNNLSVPDRATIANMSPEFGCTVTYFPADQKTLEYLEITGRSKEHIDVVEKYLKANLLWRENENEIIYTDVVELKLDTIEPSVAGPKRPQDKIPVSAVKHKFIDILKSTYERDYISYDQRPIGRWMDEGGHPKEFVPQHHKSTAALKTMGIDVETELEEKKGIKSVRISLKDREYLLSDGCIVIAAITSCTNTSNPSVMIGAGLLARKAVEKGIVSRPWVKTSLAPGSRVVTEYLKKAHLLPYLESLGFHVVGYGCTTCIGNSGPLLSHINKAILENELVVASVLSGNRNYEARIHPGVKMNFLTSPALVIAYALAGRVDINLMEEPLGYDPNLDPVFLKDIWPSSTEIQAVMKQVISASDYTENYKVIFGGDQNWKQLQSPTSKVYQWDEHSTYIKEVPFFSNISPVPDQITDILSARVLLKLGDSVTTDHISPAGSIAENSPAGKYLKLCGIERNDFNSYGSRRGNHEVMVRGTFANVRLKNEMVDLEGGWTTYLPAGERMTVYDASLKYKEGNVPLIVVAGKEYGSGSSRDWAAKGTALLGVRAVIAESFERIHRSNLVGMGILPLEFKKGDTRNSLNISGQETFDILQLKDISPNKEMTVIATNPKGKKTEFNVIARLDSVIEVAYYQNGGILQYVLRNFLK